jgi:hypothetical protein
MNSILQNFLLKLFAVMVGMNQQYFDLEKLALFQAERQFKTSWMHLSSIMATIVFGRLDRRFVPLVIYVALDKTIRSRGHYRTGPFPGL